MDTAAGHDIIAAPASTPARKHAATTQPTPSLAQQPSTDDADAARARALTRAAHELKSPLAVIKGSATTLLSHSEQWDAETQRELLRLIDAQVDRLNALLNGLLDVWRAADDMLPLVIEPVCVETLLGEVAADRRSQAPSHPLHVSTAPPLPNVSADRARFRLAVERVVDFLAAGAPDQAPVRIEPRATAGEVLLRIMRTGAALSPEEQSHLFEPFGLAASLGDAAASLGLVEARAIAHGHGGRLAVAAPGRSAALVFELALPIAETQVQPPVGETALTRLAAPRERRQIPEHPVIALVDSDAHLVRYLRTTLEEQGYRALAVPNTAQLDRLLDQEEPDLIVLDAQMPDSGGATLLGHVRARATVPLIVLGRNGDGECVRALDEGAADYIAKPFNVQELLARIRAVLRGAARAEASEPPDQVFRSGELTIDFAQRLVAVGGEPVQLSRTEYKLLRALAQQAGRVLAHDLLLERVWGPGYDGEVEFLWVYVRRLRRKLEPDPKAPRYILTIPGVGYRLAQL
jgi:DNA-binding response OmpR family regulator